MDSASYAENSWCACAHKLKSPVNLFFKFQRIICFHLTSQYFSSKPKVCFDSTVA